MLKDKLGRRINTGDGVLFSPKDTNDINFGIVKDISDYYIKLDVSERKSVRVLIRNANSLIKLSPTNYIAKEMYRKEQKISM